MIEDFFAVVGQGHALKVGEERRTAAEEGAMTQRERQRLTAAYHEAGHAVMVLLSEVKLRSITIVAKGVQAGSVLHEKVVRGRAPEYDDSPRTRIRMEKSVMITMAGPEAQRLWDPRSYRSGQHDGDRKDINDVLHFLARSVEAERPYYQLLQIWTRQSLRSKWHLVEALAKELLQRGTMGGEEAEKFIRECNMRWMQEKVAERARRAGA